MERNMPASSDYLSAKQKNGILLGADEIYNETWSWLNQRNCEKLVNKIIRILFSGFCKIHSM